MHHLLRERTRFPNRPYRLVRVSHTPKGNGGTNPSSDPEIYRIALGVNTMIFEMVLRDDLLPVLSGRRTLAQGNQRPRSRVVPRDEQRGLMEVPSKGKGLLCQIARRE